LQFRLVTIRLRLQHTFCLGPVVQVSTSIL
jgi:hypothetical protein